MRVPATFMERLLKEIEQGEREVRAIRSAGEIGFLKADDVALGNEVVKSGGNEGAAGKTVHASEVIGEAINIVGDDARNKSGKEEEKEAKGEGAAREERGGAQRSSTERGGGRGEGGGREPTATQQGREREGQEGAGGTQPEGGGGGRRG